MGAILDKLQYIAETKAMFREAIDKKRPGYITDDTPFSDYRFTVQSIPALTKCTVNFVNKIHTQNGYSTALYMVIDGQIKEITQTQYIRVDKGSLLLLRHYYTVSPSLTGIVNRNTYSVGQYTLRDYEVTQDCTISV